MDQCQRESSEVVSVVYTQTYANTSLPMLSRMILLLYTNSLLALDGLLEMDGSRDQKSVPRDCGAQWAFVLAQNSRRCTAFASRDLVHTFCTLQLLLVTYHDGERDTR